MMHSLSHMINNMFKPFRFPSSMTVLHTLKVSYDHTLIEKEEGRERADSSWYRGGTT
jgi:hypothetical protein